MIRRRILRALLKRIDLNLFAKESNLEKKLNFFERLLLSGLAKRLFTLEIANLEFCINSLPYSENKMCLGRIDFIIETTPNTYAIRGWIILPSKECKSFNIIYRQVRYPIFCFKLVRIDVVKNLGFINNSRNSGFIGILEEVDFGDEAELEFEIVTTGGETILGRFDSCTVKHLTLTPHSESSNV